MLGKWNRPKYCRMCGKPVEWRVYQRETGFYDSKTGEKEYSVFKGWFCKGERKNEGINYHEGWQNIGLSEAWIRFR